MNDSHYNGIRSCGCWFVTQYFHYLAKRILKASDYGKKLELDKKQLAADLQNEAYDDLIQADLMSGAECDVNGTPTFFINGTRFDGDWENGELLTALQSR